MLLRRLRKAFRVIGMGDAVLAQVCVAIDDARRFRIGEDGEHGLLAGMLLRLRLESDFGLLRHQPQTSVSSKHQRSANQPCPSLRIEYATSSISNSSWPLP